MVVMILLFLYAGNAAFLRINLMMMTIMTTAFTAAWSLSFRRVLLAFFEDCEAAWLCKLLSSWLTNATCV